MRRFPLQTYLFLCLGLLTAVPTLLLGAIQTQQWGAQRVAQAEHETQLAAELLARETGQLMAMHVREVESLARQVEARESLDPTKLQVMVAAQRASSDGLSLMYIGDRLGIAVAVDPPLNAAGQVAAGTDYSDRDYYREVMRTGRTAVSRAQLGKNTQRPNVQVAVTGEGIETPEQLQELRALGCDEGQGYYFARPAAGDALSRLIDAGRLGPDAVARAA
jgi:hypothetical protein